MGLVQFVSGRSFVLIQVVVGMMLVSSNFMHLVMHQSVDMVHVFT